MLERNSAVELKPSMEDLFDAVRKVCEDVMAITVGLPRLAMLGTARQLKELEVGLMKCCCCLGYLSVMDPVGTPVVKHCAAFLPAGAWPTAAPTPRELLQRHQG